jgi:serine/threonine-protein kinase RsbW
MTDAEPVRLVEVVVDAVADQVALLRSVAADVAIRGDFDLDAIEDLRMAVDEAAALLVGCATPGARLHCELRPERQQVRVRLVVDAKPDAQVEHSSMGWQILTALATEASAEAAEGRITITLARARSEKITA